MDITELTDDEQVLYDFFITFGEPVHSIEYPLAILSIWNSDGEESDNFAYSKKQAVLHAYCQMGLVDKPLYLAIKEIKGWV